MKKHNSAFHTGTEGSLNGLTGRKLVICCTRQRHLPPTVSVTPLSIHHGLSEHIPPESEPYMRLPSQVNFWFSLLQDTPFYSVCYIIKLTNDSSVWLFSFRPTFFRTFNSFLTSLPHAVFQVIFSILYSARNAVLLWQTGIFLQSVEVISSLIAFLSRSHSSLYAHDRGGRPEHLEKTHTGTKTCKGSAGSNPKSSCCEKSTRYSILDYNWNLIQATFVFTTLLYIAADITEKKQINSCCQLRAAGICYISNWSDVAHCHATIMHSRATR